MEPDRVSAKESSVPSDFEDLEASVGRMARVGSCYSPSFSPDALRLALVSDMGGIPQVWTASSSGGWPQLVSALEDPVQNVAWSPEGSYLAFSLAPGGGMNTQIYVVRPDGTGLRHLTDGGEENNWLAGWTRDGTRLLVSSNRRSASAMDAYLIEVDTGDSTLVAENPGIGALTDVSRDGGRAILYRMQDRGDDNLFLLDLKAGGETLLTSHEGPGSFTNGRFAPDGDTVYLSSNRDRDLTAFARIRLADDGRHREQEVLAAREDAELDGFELTEDGTTAALVWNVAGHSELSLLDLESGEAVPGPNLPAEIIHGLKWSSDGTRLALVLSGSTSPLDIHVFDRGTGLLFRLTESPHPGVRLSCLVSPELVRFDAHDGLGLSGWLYRPPNFEPPGPVVLDFHGGPEAQERPAFSSLYQALVEQGIGVLAPNVRGSSGFGKTFVNLDNGELRVNAIRDIEACVGYLIEAGVADPDRVGIMGGSYGGYMTMAGITTYPDTFAAAANLFGVVNFETFFSNTEPWMAAISKVEYGDPDTEREMLRELSPIHKIGWVVTPTMVLHGANDTNVPVVQAEQVVESLRGRGIPVEYVLFDDEGHGFRKTANKVRSVVAITRWFAEHL